MKSIRLISFRLYIPLLLMCFVLTPAIAQQEKKPNILMILVDDLKPNLGVYGDEHAISPNIDQLADSGMRFDQAYCNQSVCVASRYNLILGSRSTSTGLYNFGKEFREVIPDAVTLPQYFRAAGYHAEAMGKVFHIGHGNTNDEASWSVPHWKEKVIEYVDPRSTTGQLTREEAFFENTPMYIEDTPPNHELPRGAAWESPDVTDEAYGDGRVARHAIDRLRELAKDPDQPFLLAVGFARPHLPFSAPKKYWDMYDPQTLPLADFEEGPAGAPEIAVKRGGEINQFFPIPNHQYIYEKDLQRKLVHGYYASMTYMDAQVGKVLSELERLGLDENTIVVLWGDHGWHLGDHGIWTKHTNYEQANRIPIIFRVPGVTSSGSTTLQFAETVDIFPTLAALSGLDRPDVPQPIDGIDLTSTLRDASKRTKNHAYHAYNRGGYLGEAIRTDRYRMVRWTHMQDRDKDVIYELYDYQEDAGETRNIADENPEVVKELLAILAKYPKAQWLP